MNYGGGSLQLLPKNPGAWQLQGAKPHGRLMQSTLWLFLFHGVRPLVQPRARQASPHSDQMQHCAGLPEGHPGVQLWACPERGQF